MPTVVQSSLSGGELSPSLYPRTDLSRYASSYRTGTNFITNPGGGIVNRPGFQYIGPVATAAEASRLIPFEVSADIAYVVELADSQLRFVANGAFIESAPDVPFVLASPWTIAQVNDVRYTQANDTMYLVHPEVPPQVLTRLTATTFSLTEFVSRDGPFAEQNTDRTTQIYLNNTLGNVSIEANKNIFSADLVGTYLYIEPEELTSVTPWTVGDVVTGQVGIFRRSAGKEYRLTNAPLTGAATYTITGNVPPTHTFGRAWDADGGERTDGVALFNVGVEWEYRNSGFGIVLLTSYVDANTMIGRVVREAPQAVAGGPMTLLNTWNFVGAGTIGPFAVTGATKESANNYIVTLNGVEVDSNPYDSPDSPVAQGWVINVGTGQITFYDTVGVGVAIQVREYESLNRTSVFAFGAWSEVQGYPSEVEFFADRLVFANTPSQPQTLWMSETGNYVSFGKSVPLVESDSITVTLNARRLNEIRELVPLKSLLVLSKGTEWQLSTGADATVAADNIGFTAQSYYGSSTLRSLIVGNSALFTQDRGAAVRDLQFEFAVDGFQGNDISIFAKHLIEKFTIVDWTYQRIPYSVIWMVRNDGTLMTMTYLREQEILAWTPMSLTNGFVESVTCIPEGDQDAVYITVRRFISGPGTVRYIERMSNRLFDDVRFCTFADSFLTFDGRNTSVTEVEIIGVSFDIGDNVVLSSSTNIFAGGDVGDAIVFGYDSGVNGRVIIISVSDAQTASGVIETAVTGFTTDPTTDWAFARDTITGLDHLAGQSVVALADGYVIDAQNVSGGFISLDSPAVVVHVGLPYTADLETLDPYSLARAVRMESKNIKRFGVQVQASRGLYYGPSFDKMDEYTSRQYEPIDSVPALLDELQEVWATSTWSANSRMCIQQRDPLPLAVNGLLADIEQGR